MDCGMKNIVSIVITLQRFIGDIMALNGMTDEDWWEHCGNMPVERGNVTRYEDLYQLFKRRFMEEMEVQIVNSHMKGEIKEQWRG